MKLRSVMSTRVLERKDEDQPVAQEHPPADQDEENSDEERDEERDEECDEDQRSNTNTEENYERKTFQKMKKMWRNLQP